MISNLKCTEYNISVAINILVGIEMVDNKKHDNTLSKKQVRIVLNMHGPPFVSPMTMMTYL